MRLLRFKKGFMSYDDFSIHSGDVVILIDSTPDNSNIKHVNHTFITGDGTICVTTFFTDESNFEDGKLYMWADEI